MKKLIFCLVLILTAFTLSGCDNTYNVILNNTSDLRVNYFYGECNLFTCDLSCGYREEVFTYDGQSTQKLECGVLSLTFNSEYSYSTILVEVEINGSKNEYVLEHSPYDSSYVVDIEKKLADDALVTVNLKNNTSVATLKNISSGWSVNYEKALKIAAKHFASDFTSLYFNNKLNAECYLKILSKTDFENIYWYFSYVDRAGASKSILIDVSSGELYTPKAG